MTRPVILPRPDRTPTLAVWKFASCDGCQLSLLDCEDELLAVAAGLEIASFPEASSAVVDGPYDLSLVEGSITTPGDARRIREIREQSAAVVTIGACATGGGIQALRNGADIDEFVAIVYAHPEFISTLSTSTPIADHIAVDFELRGCPVDRVQLLEVITAYLNGRPPRIASTSVCAECKAQGISCVMVADRAPCLGPVTHSGCGALCPSFRRGCYGCFGPSETAKTAPLDRQFVELGLSPNERRRVWRGFSGWSPEFRAAADAVSDGTAGDDTAGDDTPGGTP
jgi:sulfhydrogenase subunit delta